MTHRKRRLSQQKHPFNSYPFEAFLSGSWQALEFITIEAGTMAFRSIDNNYKVMDKGPFSDIRIRSRKATLSDCSCFLRPGIDICVLIASQHADSSDENSLNPVWADAKISSIQRKPHESECSCQYYVNFYVNQGSLGTEVRTLNKEIKVVGINQISILQKLERNPCEDQHYRWDSSEDCFAVPQTKLLVGRFLSDLSWLVVASVLKQVSFCVRSIENNIVYQILGGDNCYSSLISDSHKHAVNFRVDNRMLVPIVAQVVQSDSNRVGHAHDACEDEVSLVATLEGLRRSKRRNVQPERYIGYDDVSELDVGYVRTRPYRINTRKDDEQSPPIPCLSGLQENCPEEDIPVCPKVDKRAKPGEVKSDDVDKKDDEQSPPIPCLSGLQENCPEEDIPICPKVDKRAKPGEVKSDDVDKKEHQTQLTFVPLPDEGNPIALDHYHINAKVTKNSAHENCEISSKYYHLIDSPKLKRANIDLVTSEPCDHSAKIPDVENSVEEINDKSSRCYYSYGTPKVQRKNLFDQENMDLESTWEGLHCNKGIQGAKNNSTSSSSRSLGEERTYKDRSLSPGAYKELIDSYLKNIITTPTTEESPTTDQWKQFKATTNFGQKKETEKSQREAEGEISEIDMLWREMEVSLASTHLLEDTEGSKAAVFAETLENNNKLCQHEFRLNEEIGIYCCKCGFVSTEIKDVSPPFMQYSGWQQEEKQCSAEYSEEKADEDDGLHPFATHASPDKPISEEHDHVWKLIPELSRKLHVHQKKAFEFLWQNIAGSVEPALMEAKSERRGGCVISHSPGAGKTFLIISFLVSYLKLFPGKRPLVLAPKTTLYTWYKEFIKWEIPIPVYLIHGRKTYRVFKQESMVFPVIPKPTEDAKHVLDCLEKIQKWHAHPSILVMGYSSFSALMQEGSKFAHRKFMAKVLRKSPGILILDEGHNPRSTGSRLRKVLMKVETELRILLSGTLFQNNFCEYFNTLCLARPKFVHEVLKELGPKYKRKKKGAEKALNLIESRARKFFLDKIAKKIDSNIDYERMQGLNMLRNITNGFIDVYEGGSSDSLPGLQIYTLLMNMTDMQHEILQGFQNKMAERNGYPLELELLITLGSIHPWLIKTTACADKFLTVEQLRELEKSKFDLKKGSKVRFVLDLVYRIVNKEKILIFCHHIAPVKLFVELFEKFFGWQKGREVLVLTGELELFERGTVMDKFEEVGGAAKILLASITACAEGISLTAASRLILLDSEWNPSKTKQAIARAFRPGQQRMVYVYQLLVTGTLEEDKYRRTTWKEWVSSMIFSEAFVEDPSRWQAEKIEDDILREMIEEDRSKMFHMIMKNEKASIN